MIEANFIEGHYFYTNIGSSGRGVQTFERRATGTTEVGAGAYQKGHCDWWQLLEKVSVFGLRGFTIMILKSWCIKQEVRLRKNR